jgi:two-component system LytT family response regulator
MSEALRTIIADDEPLARQRLRSLLDQLSGIDLIAECPHGPETINQVNALKPDLLLLDIQMPEVNGFEVVEALTHFPLIIFVTAYDQHAIRAFEVHALDYLLKPVKLERLSAAIERARTTLKGKEAALANEKILSMLNQRSAETHLNRILIKNQDRVLFVKVSEVFCLEASGNYILVHTAEASHLLRETLTSLEARLDPEKFIRISRSVIVNIDQIKEIQPLFKGDHVVVLKNGKQWTMTRGLREIEKALK